MKVLYICDYDWEGNFTLGKIYDVIDYDTDGSYTIIDDYGMKYNGYPDEWFKSLSEIRNEKIDRLLDES